MIRPIKCQCGGGLKIQHVTILTGSYPLEGKVTDHDSEEEMIAQIRTLS